MKNVLLPITRHLHEQFQAIRQQLNAGSKEKLSKPLGGVLADLSCEVIDRLFMDLIQKSKGLAVTPQEHQMVHDSEKVVHQIIETFRKYMPYAVSLFGNDRLVAVANYLDQKMLKIDDKYYITFTIEEALLSKTLACGEKMKTGDQASIVPAFEGLIKIIDRGVDVLVREPKNILKFNFVVDKTLTGVLNMTTHLGYKRLEKLATQMNVKQAAQYVDHFIGFVDFSE